jgi:nucleotide-binding universal stress UspA family protein
LGRNSRESIVHARLAFAAERLRQSGFPANQIATMSVETSDVRNAVLEAINLHHADVVIVGTRGHNSLAGLVLGSLSTYLTQNSPVPVLIARENATYPTEVPTVEKK